MSSATIGCESFWDYLDEGLGLRETDAYREHLAACPACRLNLEEVAAVAEALRWGNEEEPPAAIRKHLTEEFRRIHRTSVPGNSSHRWLSLPARPLAVPAWVAATVLLGVLGLFYIVLERRELGMATLAEIPAGEETVAYQVYGPDGALRATVQTTASREGIR